MSAARDLLALAERAGVTLYREGDQVRWQAPSPPPPELLESLRQHKAELAKIVPAAEAGNWRTDLAARGGPATCAGTPPRAGRCFRCGSDFPDGVEIAECRACRCARGAAPVATDTSGPWIVSSASQGSMRLLVAAHPRDWSGTVFRAAALVEVLDARHRADRADAQDVADELKALFGALKREGVVAWLTS